MKLILIALVVTLCGCASNREPLSFDQRIALMNAMNANRYVLPAPPVMGQARQAPNYYCTPSAQGSYCTPQ